MARLADETVVQAAAMTTAPARTEHGAAPSGDRFPSGIPFIIGNEGAERFSYYGLRQILYVYLAALYGRMLAAGVASPAELDPQVRSTQIAHLFMAAAYAFPMIGAILADRLLGKFRVILYVSIIYAAGNALMAVAAWRGMVGDLRFAELGAYAGLALVAIGSGGIKPCVSANVGDQFTAENQHLVTRVFQIFYFIINFGSFFASIITPLLLRRVNPAAAFALPGVLMIVATVVFFIGRHRFVRVPPRATGRLGLIDFTSSVLLFAPIAALLVAFFAGERSHGASAVATYAPYALVGVGGFVAGVALFAWRQRQAEDAGFLSVLLYAFTHRRERAAGEGFFASAARHFGQDAAEGPPAVLRILVVFSAVTVFWALFDQHSTTWVEQARHMDLRLTVPAWVFDRFVVPATMALALFGVIWLLAWVSNRPIPRNGTRAVFALVAVWAVGATVAQLIDPRTSVLELQAAQLAGLNPLLVMIVIPAMNVLVYRPLERRGRPLAPLLRMALGMFITAVSFGAIAVLQQRIDAVGEGQVPVLWQIVPYVLVTVGEVLVSITGLEFAYTQAPRAMKSTIMGFWALFTTFGNMLVVALAPLQGLSMARFFWVFTALMVAAALVFTVLARTYKGRTYLQTSGGR